MGGYLALGLEASKSETGFYTTPPLEGKIATDTLTSFPAPVVYKISGPMGGGFDTPLALRPKIRQ